MDISKKRKLTPDRRSRSSSRKRDEHRKNQAFENLYNNKPNQTEDSSDRYKRANYYDEQDKNYKKDDFKCTSVRSRNEHNSRDKSHYNCS